MGLYVGPMAPVPLAADLVEQVEQVTVTHQDGGRSGFQITLAATRDRAGGREDVAPLLAQVFRISNRVQVTATIGVTPHVLMDGIITNLQLTPGGDPGTGRLTVTGEDVSVMLDLYEVSLPFPAMKDGLIAALLLAPLAAFGTIPLVIPEPFPLVELPTQGIPHLTGTFQGMLHQLAERWGYDTYYTPGPVRGVGTAYWGPPIRAGVPQRALTWRMGPATNLGSIQFTLDGTKPKMVYGLIKESTSGAEVPIVGLPFTGQPMAALPAYVGDLPFVGLKRMESSEGGSVIAALGRATGEVFRANRGAATASGELDVARYGDVLDARALVGVRGVGRTMDGTWYVRSTTHTIARGSWKQAFELEREGTIAQSTTVAVG
jgi:hypothetical protein